MWESITLQYNLLYGTMHTLLFGYRVCILSHYDLQKHTWTEGPVRREIGSPFRMPSPWFLVAGKGKEGDV